VWGERELSYGSAPTNGKVARRETRVNLGVDARPARSYRRWDTGTGPVRGTEERHHAGRMAARIGGKTVVVLGALIGTFAMGLLAFAHSHTWELYVATAVMGIGFGLAFAAMSSLIVSAVPAEQTGVASGMNANIRTIGGSIGAALMASVVTANPAADGLPREAGYTHGFAMLGVALLVAAVAAMLIPVGRRPGRIALTGRPEPVGLAAAPGGTVVGDRPE
jgi:MFS family permease